MDNSFINKLKMQLPKYFSNNFGIENFDQPRFGKYPEPNQSKNTSFLSIIKLIIKKVLFIEKRRMNHMYRSKLDQIIIYESKLQKLYDSIGDESKELLLKLMLYKVLGYRKVKLPRNNDQYWNTIELVKDLKDSNDTYDPHFMHFILEKFDLSPLGIPLKIYFSDLGICIDFLFEQYAYKSNGCTIIEANQGDIVLDAGGCWGDTALYFAHKIGENGKVYSFEFIPDNIKLFNINKSLNPHLENRIDLVQKAVSNCSNQTIYYKDNGPGSKIKMSPFEDQTGQAFTITIDDFVKENKIEKIDFIKMDIEGAEPIALEGAIETIKKFRPKLAIAIYHSMSDFVNIPNWIMDLNLDYEIFIGHYTIHLEETICFAKTKSIE